MLPESEEPVLYWADNDPRTIKGHQGIVSRIILDFDPFHMVERRGFAMDMRLNMPQYKIRTHHFYAGLVDKAYENSYQGVINMLQTDDPEEIWMTLDGWSAVTTTLSQEGIQPQGWVLQDISNESFVCYQDLSEYVGL